MKKVMFLLLVVMVALAGAQQDMGRAFGAGSFDSWTARKDSVLSTRFYVDDDSVFSEVMLAWGTMGLDVVVGDSSSAVTDSVKYAIDLYGWHQYRNRSSTTRTTDLANFCFIKTLDFNGSDRTLVSLDSLTKIGSYQAMLTAATQPPVIYFRLCIRPLTDAKTLPGNYLDLKVIARKD